MKTFINDVKREWNKIAWEKKDSVMKETAVVVGVSAVMGVMIAAVDFCGQWLMNLLMAIHF